MRKNLRRVDILKSPFHKEVHYSGYFHKWEKGQALVEKENGQMAFVAALTIRFKEETIISDDIKRINRVLLYHGISNARRKNIFVKDYIDRENEIIIQIESKEFLITIDEMKGE